MDRCVDPRNYSATDTLRDGTPITVRSIGTQDAKSVLEAFGKLDSDSVYKRFFTFKKTLSDSEVRQLTEVDPNRVAALVATQGSELIGGARYIIDAQRNSAELAFVTGADHCRLGIASMLLRHLIVLARRQRLEALEAEVLAENGAMLTVFRRSGLPMQTQIAGNTVHVTLKLAQA